ncbi:MAG: serine hydrolase domain-containing protein [Labilithrix sp.]
MKSLSALALSALLVASGCNATTSEEAVTSDSALEGDAACAAEAARFDAQLARIPHATYDAVMETKTACGTRFHTVGPTHVDEHRLVRVGSMTKSFVSVVTLQLVAEGKVKLDDRLDVYLPDVPSFASGVTVRQILQHTSGLFNYTETQEFWTALSAHPDQPISVDEILALSAARPAYFAAGGGWHYSNTNYILAGLLVEKVDERPIAESIRARILEPNDLHETFFDGEETVAGVMVPGFDKNGVDVTNTYDLSWAWAAGAMVSTPPDMTRFLELLGSGRLLPPAEQAELTTKVATPQPGLGYGLGVFMSDASITGGLGPAIGHGGDIMGYHSWGLYFPEKKVTFFGCVASDRGNGNDVMVAALTAMLGP